MRTTLKIIVIAAVAAGLCTQALLFYIFDPAQSRLFGVCIFHKFTGLYCPGCGSSRAAHQLLHGHIAKAFGYNPLLIISLPLGIIASAVIGICWLRASRVPAIIVKPVLLWIAAGAIVVFWVLRNLPVWPCTLLAP